MSTSSSPRRRPIRSVRTSRGRAALRGAAPAVATLALLGGCSTATSTAPAAVGTTTSTASPDASGTPNSTPTGVEAVAPGAALTAGSIGENTLAPVPLAAEAQFGEGLGVHVESVEDSTVSGIYPGEISGPGVVVRLTFSNGSAVAVDLDGVRVNASLPDGTPASALEGPPAQAPTGVLAPDSTAEGTFVFSLPQGTASSLTLEITSTSSADVVMIDV